MKNTLAVVAQMVMDLFYQQFAMPTDFLRLEHFKFVVASAYAALLQEEYEKTYRRNLMETGHGYVEINPDWLIMEEIKMDKGLSQAAGHGVIKMDRPFFAFRYDQSTVAIQMLELKNHPGKDIVRVSAMERFKLRHHPAGKKAYWFAIGDLLHIHAMEYTATPFIIWYVPSLAQLDDDQLVPINLNDAVMKASLNLLFAAKNGTPIIDKTNDGNPNKVMESEINNAFRQP